MSELATLKKENRKLRLLLATANELLAKSKDLLAQKTLARAVRKTSKSSSRKRPKRR